MLNRDYYKDWFNAFCAFYYENDEGHDKNYRLKEEHTHRVCDNIIRISYNENVSSEVTEIAWLCGLFHDLGRFPQYRQYRTFKDSISVNHGLLSAKIIEDADILNDLTSTQKQALCDALRFHNAYQMPPEIKTADGLFCLKVLRDADKLDIWKVFIDYYADNKTERPSAMCLGLPDGPTHTKGLVDEILKGKTLKLANIKTLNDFKLLQLSWLFDLNFSESFRIFFERGYLHMMRDSLPQTADIFRLFDFLEAYLKKVAGTP